MHEFKPLIAIIATPCTGLKGWSAINRVKNYSTWLKSRSVSIPLGDLGAEVALFQLKGGREFLSENPLGSDLYHLEGWRTVAQHPRTMTFRVDMCAAGLKDPESRMPILKASEIWCSNPLFAESLYDLRCSQNHQHAILAGTYKGQNRTHLARVWTWEFSSRIASAVSAIIRQYHTARQTRAYTGGSGASSSGAPPPPPEETPPPKKPRSKSSVWKCPMCRQNAHQHHVNHWRNQDCKWGQENTPGHAPTVWSCPACVKEVPRHSTTPKHTLKWVNVAFTEL